jgi:hypothetical protein
VLELIADATDPLGVADGIVAEWVADVDELQIVVPVSPPRAIRGAGFLTVLTEVTSKLLMPFLFHLPFLPYS